MSDAIALFRPKDKEKLLPFLDLDEDDESDRLYAEELDDGSFLVFTFQPLDAFRDGAWEWLEPFGDALPDVHDDPRGLLFFPGDCDPHGNTYDAVVSEVEAHGFWVPLTAAMPTSFDLGMMVEGMQREIFDALTAQMENMAEQQDAELDAEADEDEEP